MKAGIARTLFRPTSADQSGTWARNDLLQWASAALPDDQQRSFLDYAESLPQMSCVAATSHLPRGKPIQDRPPTAEQLTYDYLEAGHTSLWTRQVLQHLQYDPLQRFQHRQEANGPNWDKGQVFRVGAFFRVLPGVLKDTLTHHNVTILLNEFVRRCHPDHTWTSVEVMVDVMAPPHRDARNSPTGTFLTQLSLSDRGHLWIEQEGGTHFQDIPQLDQLRPGQAYDIRGQGVLFRADSLWHATMPWTGFNRVVIAAYSVKGSEHFSTGLRQRLLNLGFGLPPCNSPPPVSLLPPTVE